MELLPVQINPDLTTRGPYVPFQKNYSIFRETLEFRENLQKQETNASICLGIVSAFGTLVIILVIVVTSLVFLRIYKRRQKQEILVKNVVSMRKNDDKESNKEINNNAKTTETTTDVPIVAGV
uniref:Uncharacterized protein n=1 Tax=Panagrolaimus sp. JU765 TaxID=591449 RepID=A0AC34Q1F8_9BILA